MLASPDGMDHDDGDVVVDVVALRSQVAGLVRLNTGLNAQIARLVEENTRLQGLVLMLQTRLHQDSSNSSLPPSSDRFPGSGSPRQRSLRRASGRHPGGQEGHPGTTLRQVAHPDLVIDQFPVTCGACGEGLDATGAHDQAKVVVRQVFDLPEPRLVVTEYRLHQRVCGACGAKTSAPDPAGVTAPVQYGPRLAGAVVFEHEYQVTSQRRAAQGVAGFSGVTPSVGTVANMQARTAERLAGFVDTVKHQLVEAPVIGADETGLNVDQQLVWAHVYRDETRTLIEVHPKRGQEAMHAIGVLDDFEGVVVHDALRSYDSFDQHEDDQLCAAHLLRELQAVTDVYQAHPGEFGDPDLPVDWIWSQQVADAILAIKQACDQAEDHRCPAEVLAKQSYLIKSAAWISLGAGWQGPPEALGRKHLALARRITSRLHNYLLFATDARVPFDNNGAERDLRMAKLRMKVSGGLRTISGAKRYTRIRSYLSTCMKNSIDVITALANAYQYRPYIPAPG